MKLGSYVEILHYVDDVAAAGAYYEKLGLVALGDDVYTDGRYHLHLVEGAGPNPGLRYFGSDIAALRAGGLAINGDRLISPAGVNILLSSDPPPRDLPHDNVARAPDITRLGKFGELSAFIPDIDVECAFWEAAGYETLGRYVQPSPWGIWLDKLMLIGLHQDDVDEPFAICHFSPDMKDVNGQLKAEGFDLQPFDTSGDPDDLTWQKLMTPYGLMFYLFTGDISDAQP
ncbi:MAG: hypothetical protein OXI34_05245 [Chloroflexota bacterium]|nr:hypothetical protein [Chloroflexota bacterium]MDE2855295.1 hypothetical protein [Chloroflexota bacterium]MDE2947379.1 hypothetical protein [Chloroflexota bacterium]